MSQNNTQLPYGAKTVEELAGMQRRANRDHGGDLSRLPEVLLSNWADMVTDAHDQCDEYRRQLRVLDERATRLHRDNVVLHGLINEAYAETGAHERLALRLSALVLRIIRENPAVAIEAYRDEYLAAINDFNGQNPIDLTADEELDEDM